MASPPFDEQDQNLLGEAKSILAAERAERTETQRRRFLARVLANLNSRQDTPQAKSFLWFSKKKILYLAAGLFLGFLGVMAMMTDMFGDHESRPRELRLKATKVPVLDDTHIIQDPDLWADVESQTLILIVYEHFGERCLWLYPEQQWHGESDSKRKTWRVRVADGRVEIPVDALAEACPAGDDLVLLRVRKHYEIWSTSSLNRYFEKSAKKI